MFHSAKGKKKEKKETTEDGDIGERALFSYTVACSLRWQHFHFAWTLIEKGSCALLSKYRYEISYSTIKRAATQIREYIFKTPCFKSEYTLSLEGYNIYFRKEFYQVTDSIIARGVIYTLLQLSKEHKRKGVIAISTGSFGFILCYYGCKFRIPVTVVLPKSTAVKNINLCKQYSDSQISVLVEGDDMLEAHKFALIMAMKKGLYYIAGHNHPNMIIGQATVGLEIIQQEPKINTVLLPTTINSCRLTIGIAMALKGQNRKINVIEVQCTDLDSLYEDVIQQTDLFNKLTIPIRQYVGCPLRNLPRCVIDRSIPINHLMVRKATSYLYKTERYYDRYGGIALTPISSGLLDELKGKRVVIPLFGRMD